MADSTQDLLSKAEHWRPSQRASRHMAARLLKSFRSGYIAVSAVDEIICVDACMLRYLTPTLRKKIGALWLTHGQFIMKKDANRRNKKNLSDKEIKERELLWEPFDMIG